MEKGQNRNFREAGVEWSDHLHGESAVPYKLTILSCTVNQRSKIIEFKLNRDTGLGSLSRSNLSREQASGCKYLEEKTMKDNFYIPFTLRSEQSFGIAQHLPRARLWHPYGTELDMLLTCHIQCQVYTLIQGFLCPLQIGICSLYKIMNIIFHNYIKSALVILIPNIVNSSCPSILLTVSL